jgi:hypothetical protein
MFTEKLLVNANLIQQLRFTVRKTTIKAVRTRGQAMPKRQTAKAKVNESDPVGDIMTAEFVTQAFKEAVEDVWEENRQKGLDSYGTIDGKMVAVKPDGTVEPVVFNPKRTNG